MSDLSADHILLAGFSTTGFPLNFGSRIRPRYPILETFLKRCIDWVKHCSPSFATWWPSRSNSPACCGRSQGDREECAPLFDESCWRRRQFWYHVEAIHRRKSRFPSRSCGCIGSELGLHHERRCITQYSPQPVQPAQELIDDQQSLPKSQRGFHRILG
jgi:hypothetical protein